MAARLGVNHAVCLSQARTGIYLALRSLIQPGQEVVLSPYTFYDVVNMVICAGGRPVFADVREDTTNIDPAEVERLVTDDTGAVIATHLHGLACDVERISKLCKRKGIPLLEDAAQSFGARVSGQHLGTFGKVGIFSFSRVKNVSALFGGMLVTNDAALNSDVRDTLQSYPPESSRRLIGAAFKCFAADVMTSPLVFPSLTFSLLRFDYTRGVDTITRFVQAEKPPFMYETMPSLFKKRMRPVQARLVRKQLDNVDADSAARIRNARLYHEGLADLSDVRLAPFAADSSNIYLAFPLQVPDRESVVRHLLRRGRDVRPIQFTNTADADCFSRFARNCPNARRAEQRGFLLPTYPDYSEREIRKNVQALREYFGAA